MVADLVASQEVLEEARRAEAPQDSQVVVEPEASELEVEKVVLGSVPAPFEHLALMPLFHPTAT